MVSFYAHYYRTVQRCMRYFIYGILLINFLVLIQIRQYFMIKGGKFDVSWIIVEETDSNSLLPCIHKNRSQLLNNKCIHLNRSVSAKKKPTFASLVKEFPWLRDSILSLQSHSLAYCAIPKIASKSFLTLMIYVYIRDAIDHVDANVTNIVVNKARVEQLLNIQKLHEGLRQVSDIVFEYF